MTAMITSAWGIHEQYVSGLTGDGLGGTAFAGRDHDEKLHDGIVDLLAAALHDEDILITDGGLDADGRLAVAELTEVALGRLSSKSLTDSIDKPWMRRAGEDLDPPHGSEDSLW